MHGGAPRPGGSPWHSRLARPPPDFTLRNQFGQTVSLSDFRGKKVVVMFYPFAFTSTCTGEMCAIKDRIGDFDNDDTVMVSISCDPTASLKVFAETEGLTHQLLSDFWPHGEVSRAYEAFWEKDRVRDAGDVRPRPRRSHPLVGGQRSG